MRPFFKLVDDVTVPERCHLSYVRQRSGEEPVLNAGEAVAIDEPLVAEVSHPGRALEFTRTSFNVPVATRRLATAVQQAAGSDVQCLPVHVESHPEMMVLNACRVVRCLDETRSDFLKWTAQDHRTDLAGQYRQVTELVLTPGSVPDDAHFFRIEGWTVALVVSETVKTAMERAGSLGAMFEAIPG